MAGESPANPARPSSRTTPVLVPQGAYLGKPDIPLDRPVTTVGSDPGCRLGLSSRTVSKTHAVFVNSSGSTYVCDLASRTGVIVNGKPVHDAELKTGDRVQIGKFVFRFRSPANPSATAGGKESPPAVVIPVGSPAVAVSSRCILIGRRETCEVPLTTDAAVSAAHAIVFQLEGTWQIRDLYSRTGTSVNGKTIHQKTLRFGDRVQIGSANILFQPGAAPSRQPEPSADLEPDSTVTASESNTSATANTQAAPALDVPLDSAAFTNTSGVHPVPVDTQEPAIPLRDDAGSEVGSGPIPLEEPTATDLSANAQAAVAPVVDSDAIPLAEVPEQQHRFQQPGQDVAVAPPVEADAAVVSEPIAVSETVPGLDADTIPLADDPSPLAEDAGSGATAETSVEARPEIPTVDFTAASAITHEPETVRLAEAGFAANERPADEIEPLELSDPHHNSEIHAAATIDDIPLADSADQPQGHPADHAVSEFAESTPHSFAENDSIQRTSTVDAHPVDAPLAAAAEVSDIQDISVEPLDDLAPLKWPDDVAEAPPAAAIVGGDSNEPTTAPNALESPAAALPAAAVEPALELSESLPAVKNAADEGSAVEGIASADTLSEPKGLDVVQTAGAPADADAAQQGFPSGAVESSEPATANTHVTGIVSAEEVQAAPLTHVTAVSSGLGDLDDFVFDPQATISSSTTPDALFFGDESDDWTATAITADAPSAEAVPAENPSTVENTASSATVIETITATDAPAEIVADTHAAELPPATVESTEIEPVTGLSGMVDLSTTAPAVEVATGMAQVFETAASGAVMAAVSNAAEIQPAAETTADAGAGPTVSAEPVAADFAVNTDAAPEVAAVEIVTTPLTAAPEETSEPALHQHVSEGALFSETPAAADEITIGHVAEAQQPEVEHIASVNVSGLPQSHAAGETTADQATADAPTAEDRGDTGTAAHASIGAISTEFPAEISLDSAEALPAPLGVAANESTSISEPDPEIALGSDAPDAVVSSPDWIAPVAVDDTTRAETALTGEVDDFAPIELEPLADETERPLQSLDTAAANPAAGPATFEDEFDLDQLHESEREAVVDLSDVDLLADEIPAVESVSETVISPTGPIAMEPVAETPFDLDLDLNGPAVDESSAAVAVDLNDSVSGFVASVEELNLGDETPAPITAIPAAGAVEVSADQHPETLGASVTELMLGDEAGASVTVTEPHAPSEELAAATLELAGTPEITGPIEGLNELASAESAIDAGDEPSGLLFPEDQSSLASEVEEFGTVDDLVLTEPIDEIQPVIEASTPVTQAVSPESALAGGVDDLEFLDFSDDETSAGSAAATVTPEPPAVAPPPIELPTPSADAVRRGPSLFGFEFEGGSFLGGAPLPLQTQTSLSPAVPKPVDITPASVVPPINPVVAPAISSTAGRPSPVFDLKSKGVSGLSGALSMPPSSDPARRPKTPPRPNIQGPRTQVQGQGQPGLSLTGLGVDSRSNWASQPEIPPTPAGAQTEETRRPASPAASGSAPASAPPGVDAAGRTRNVEVFSQLTKPIGIEVFSGKPATAAVPEIPALVNEERVLTGRADVSKVSPVQDQPFASRGKSKIPLLLILLLLIPTALSISVFEFVPTSARVVGKLAYSGLDKLPTVDANTFFASQKTRLDDKSDMVRTTARALLVNDHLAPGFTDNRVDYDKVIERPGAVTFDESDNALALEHNSYDTHNGPFQVEAVLKALRMVDRDLDDARSRAQLARDDAAEKQSLLAAKVKDLDKQRVEQLNLGQQQPSMTELDRVDTAAATARQKYTDAKAMSDSCAAVLADLRKQDPSQPIDVDSDSKVIELRRNLAPLNDQISRLKQANTAAPAGPGLASAVNNPGAGPTTQPAEVDPLLMLLQKQADDLNQRLQHRLDELNADKALTADQRRMNLEKEIEVMSVNGQEKQKVTDDAKLALDQADKDANDLHAKLDAARAAGARADDLTAQEQAADKDLKQAAADAGARQADLDACVVARDAKPQVITAEVQDPRLPLSVVGSVIVAGLVLWAIFAELRRPVVVPGMTPQAAPMVNPPRPIPWPQPHQIAALDEQPAPVQQHSEQLAGI